MSHFSQIKTQIRNLTALKSALTDLGIDWQPGPQKVRGYRNQTCNADLVVQQNNGHDLGFSWNGSDYELITDLDFWQQSWSVKGFLNQVTQRYAYHTVMNETTQQGFQLAEEQQNNDGSIRLVLQRWSG